MTRHGWHDATLDETAVRLWWEKTPTANVAIACGPSNLAVLDVDHGIATAEDAEHFLAALGIPETYMVRTGRRPEYGLQVYFEGAIPDVGLWKAAGGEGQIKSAGGYVMAAGSIHPDSKLAYEVADSAALAGTPAVVREMKPERAPSAADDGAPITSNRNVALTSMAGKLRNAGLSAAALEAALAQVNTDRCVPPLGDDEVSRIAANASKWELPQDGPEVLIGKPESNEPVLPVDWRSRYHSPEDLLYVEPGRFMVEGILYEGSIVGLAGYAGDRKSIVSLNLAASCVTGEPFMGHFKVANRPKRVLYLCPEMGLREVAERAHGLGMMPLVGKDIFFRTLDKAGKMRLPELTPEELDGALVVLDTAIRFLEGSENDPQDMARFADELFRLRSDGATVWVLFHSSKASVGQDLTLQNAVRGSGELAAMLSACWATRLTDPADRFGSPSRMYPMKVREFEALPFEFGVDRATAACSIIGAPATEAMLRSRKDDAARDALARILAAEPDLGINKIRERLKAAGYGKGQQWVTRTKTQINGSGVTVEA
jgi:hypothetical protein